AHEVKTSTTFPFPSSPHWAPTMTTLDIGIEYHELTVDEFTSLRVDGFRGCTLVDRSTRRLVDSQHHLLHPPHVRQLAQLLERLAAGRRVDVHQRQRLAGSVVAGERELGDVHLRLAQRAAH